MAGERESSSSREDRWRTIFGAGVLAAVALWIGWAVLVSEVGIGLKEGASWGDGFGGINALFSGLGLAGVAATLYLQSRELRLQLDELTAQRREVALQRKAVEEQAAEIRSQGQVLQRQLDLAVLSAFVTVFPPTAGGEATRTVGARMRDVLQSLANEASARIHNELAAPRGD